EKQINNESQAIQELMTVFNNYTNMFIFEVLAILIEDLEFFEISKTPVALFVIQWLLHLEASLQSGILEPPISLEMKSKFENNNFEIESYITIFCEAY
ncbi:16364_t:CDS:2, partial [Gigaspora margarita]